MVEAEDVESFVDPSAELMLTPPNTASESRPCERPRVSAAEAKKACAVGDGDACANVAEVAMCGGAVANGEPSLATLERACALGSEEGCHHFATALIAGNLGRRDVRRGLRVHHRACRHGSTRACGSLGAMLVSIGKPGAVARGVSYLEQACAGGYLDACGTLAALEASGVGNRAKNPARAASIARDACEKGNKQACNVLAELSAPHHSAAPSAASAPAF